MSIILPRRFSSAQSPPYPLISAYSVSVGSAFQVVSNEVFFSVADDGTQMYLCRNLSNVQQRLLSPAWNEQTTATTTGVWTGYGRALPTPANSSDTATSPRSFHVAGNGTRLIAGGPVSTQSNKHYIGSWKLNTKNDTDSDPYPSSAVFQDRVRCENITGFALDRDLRNLRVKSDGTTLICRDATSGSWRQLNFGTPWVTTTLSDAGVAKNPANNGIGFIEPNGQFLYCHNSSRIYQYEMTTKWDLSTLNTTHRSLITGMPSVMRGFHVDKVHLLTYNSSGAVQHWKTP